MARRIIDRHNQESIDYILSKIDDNFAELFGLAGAGVNAVNTAISTVGAGTLTGAAIAGGIITRSGSTAVFTDTTDTAANIIAALGSGAQVGDGWFLYLVNTTQFQETISAGTGVTLAGPAVTAIGANCMGIFFCKYTAAGAVTMTLLAVVDRGIDNFNATADPTTSNDSTQGYGVGSIWFNTTAGQLRWWECRDATATAAKWVFSGADYVNGGTNPSNEVTQFGSGTAVCAAEGNINRQVPGVAGGVAPAGTGSDYVVAVYSIPANTLDGLAGTNRMITVEAWVQFAANANTKLAKLWFNPTTAVVGSIIGGGGTLMASTGPVTQNGGSASLSGSVIKRGAAGSNTQTVLPQGVSLSGSHAGLTTPAADTTAIESGAILVALTINNTTAVGDAVGVAFQVNGMN